jgi:NAD(P)-dependent dehydrogenase (short-subunit alcohol dehydrogenase family)
MEKVLLITGASGGMGSALIRDFAAQGYVLALHHHHRTPQLEESERVAHFKADLSKEEEVNALAEAVLERFGRVDIVVHNAGISRSGMSWKMDTADWRQTMAVNVDAAFFLSRAIVPHMRAQKFGRIVHISSVVAQTGFIGTAAYAASKAALLGLTKSMSKELISSGITVNALALGYFEVGMIEDVPDEMRAAVVESIPAKRLGETHTVSATLQWLFSDEAAYVTGQTINLNGGLYS